MTDLEPILSTFQPISLKMMDDVKLQDRVDTKFMFRDDKLIEILEAIKQHYQVLEVNGKRFNNYETLYFDTERFDLYLRHHNGRLNRFKFRSRRYVESNLHFFEVKFKNNKGRTIKDRIKRPDIVHEITDQSHELVKSLSSIDPSVLHSKLWVNYRRMTFVNMISKERLTLDTHLVFKDKKREIPFHGLVIGEVKQATGRDKSPFIETMKNFSIHERSISKYCLGVISLHPDIKHNNFKPTLLYLKKLLKAS